MNEARQSGVIGLRDEAEARWNTGQMVRDGVRGLKGWIW